MKLYGLWQKNWTDTHHVRQTEDTLSCCISVYFPRFPCSKRSL